MRRLTIEAIQFQAPRNIAVELISRDFVENPELFAIALYNWLGIRVRVMDEFEELLRSPIVMIDEIERKGMTFGDCDCLAMLSAAILGSAGALVRFRAVEPRADGSYGHVLTEYKFPRSAEWTVFDLTVPANGVTIGNDSLTLEVIS